MPKNKDFKKIYDRFVKAHGKKKGSEMYYAWLNKKGYDDTKPFPKKEKKEFMCPVRGVEIKEDDLYYHVEGLVATTHVDGIGDKIPVETLESFAEQINTFRDARIMGVHHSEGRYQNPEFFGEADIESNPAKVIPLSDGEMGLYVDTKLLKDDPKTPDIIHDFETGELNSFSITYDTNGFMTTDFEFINDEPIRILNPETRLYGYTAANNPVNPNAIATGFGFKEFKELVVKDKKITKLEVETMQKESKEDESLQSEVQDEQPQTPSESVEPKPEEGEEETQPQEDTEDVAEESVKESVEPEEMEKEDPEKKEFLDWKENKKKALEEKERLALENSVAEKVLEKMETKEEVLNNTESKEQKEVSLEVKEFRDVLENPTAIEVKEQFNRAAKACDAIGLDWRSAKTSLAEGREFKSFGVNGRNLEYKGLGLTTNQNTDTDYLQSAAELQDVYDPVIYNALNQATLTWNVLSKDDYSGKGNNQVQFTLKTAANASASFYTGNAVSTDNVTRLKYQTKFKKLQVGVSVDGDMIAAARGGPVSDVFAQEVMDSTMDMLAVLNSALYAEVGLETASAIIGFEYITDSAGNTALYNLTRSSANKLSPDSASDTYINGGSAVVSMTNLRSAITQAVNEGANKNNLVFFTNPVQGNMLRGKFDDSRRMLNATDTDFGFSTDLFIDGVPVFEDKDCNTDDIFLVDLETHRVAIWVPPTIERLGKTADNEEAFIKMYLATYNRAPRRMVQIYGNATS